MGNDEPETPSKPEKASSPVKEQQVVHPYPADWAAVQAYYASVGHPPPYFSTAVGHPPHPYMWGPQPMMAPFGSPYAAIYPPGVYPHPATAFVPSPSTTDVPAKSSNSKDQGLLKKLKGFDGLAVSIGNVNAEITVGDGSGQSQSGDNGTEGSSDGSDDNNESGGKENHRKRCSEDTLTSGDKKASMLAPNAVNGGETSAPPNICTGFVVPPSAITCTAPPSSQMATQLKAGVHPEYWAKDERELKREKRKQSNRESARRSRLRKQAETEELAMKVDSLGAENMSLKSEIHRLKENSEKLRAENSSLMGRLKNGKEISDDKQENQEAPSIVVENFLSRIDELRQDENHDNSNSNGGNLRQLLSSSPRTDAVAAG